MKNVSLGAFLAACSMMTLLISCSGSSSSDEVVAEESLHVPGVSVAAVGFDDACPISLSLVNGQGDLFSLADGDYVEPGNRTFAVEASCDTSTIDRVFVSDGAAYQVEALPQDGRFVCEFVVREESLYQTVLIQVIHPGGRASKEKIVLKTYTPVPAGSYVKNGVGVMVSQGLLDLRKQGLALMLDEKIEEVFDSLNRQGAGFIAGISYGDNDPETVDVTVHTLEAVHLDDLPRAVLRLQFTVQDVSLSALPLYGQHCITTVRNDFLVETCLAVEDAGPDGEVGLVFDLLDTAGVAFSQPFFFQSLVERAIAFELGRIELPPLAIDPADAGYDLANLLPGNIQVFGSDMDVQKLAEGLDPGPAPYIFADIYGIPEMTEPGILALGLGLSSQPSEEVVWKSPRETVPPNQVDLEIVFNDLFESAIDEVFANIRQKKSGLVANLSYGDGDPATNDFSIDSLHFHDTDSNPDVKTAVIRFTVKQVYLEAVFLFGIPLVTTGDNDLHIAATFSIEHREDETGKRIILDTRSVEDVDFDHDISPSFCTAWVEDMIRTDLEEMEAREYDIGELTAGFEIGLDLSGSFFGTGPYAAFPDLYSCIQEPGWLLALPETCSLSLAISQTVVNQLLAAVAGPQTEWDVYDLVVALLGEGFPGFKQDRSATEQTVMRLSVPPVIDLRGSRMLLEVPDIVFQYRTGGRPQWEASVDVCLAVSPAAHGYRLDMDLSRIPGKNRFHVMKDNPGNLGIFDHSSLANDILGSLPQLMGGSADAPFLSFDLDNWEPRLVFEDRDEPVIISAGGGYLYLDMAISDFSLLP